MERVQFIKELSNELAYLVKPSELHRLIDYYDEMILDLMEDGYSEHEAVAKLGSPKALAQEAAGIPEFEVKVSRKRGAWIGLALILGFPLWGSLAFAGLMLLLSVYIVVWCIPFTTAIFGGVSVLAGLASAILSPLLMQDALFMGVTQLGLGMFFFGIGILSLIVTYRMSDFFLRGSRQVTMSLKRFFLRSKQAMRA